MSKSKPRCFLRAAAGAYLFACAIAPADAMEFPAAGFTSLAARSAFYRARYALRDTSQKKVDDSGNGDAALYGARNFRAVLPGVLYRGGANNVHFKGNPRPNMNPLQTPGLENLCQEGFGQAIYLYSDHFDTAPKQVTCKNLAANGDASALTYATLDPLTPAPLHEALRRVRLVILDPSAGPIYAHCWNGWHASGMLAAAALIQFCGISSADAVKYWNLNTDGNDGASYEGVRKRITAFKADPSLAIDAATRQAVCPNLNGEFKTQ